MSIKEEIAQLPIYMPSSLPKHFVGTDLASDILKIIVSSLPDNPYGSRSETNSRIIILTGNHKSYEGFEVCLDKIKKKLEGE